MERDPTLSRKIEKHSNPNIINLSLLGLLCFSIFLLTRTHTHTYI